MAGCLVIASITSLAVALSVSGRFSHDPKIPEPSTGHTVALSARGLGTVYLTDAEWRSVAVYWNTFYCFIAVSVVFFIAYLIYVGYQNFMREWRRPD